MPTNVVLFEEPDKILMSRHQYGQIFIVNVRNVSRTKEAVDYAYTI